MTTHKVYVDTESLSKEELKELGMEKLRELLNEFDPYIQKDGEHRDNLWYYVLSGESAIFTRGIGILIIISKEYGFIKRLVENDKIDLWKLPKGFEYIQGFGLTNRVIMILAIQDNPIEFLIDILA